MMELLIPEIKAVYKGDVKDVVLTPKALERHMKKDLKYNGGKRDGWLAKKIK